jgi:hypothetical protein
MNDHEEASFADYLEGEEEREKNPINKWSTPLYTARKQCLGEPHKP